MTHIKKLVMQGFKSFPKKTEIMFDPAINTIVGPNGSGKSNVSDALCFALGRLSIKSMRAAKAKNLLFMGSKYVKPAKEAFVELSFDNTNGTFNLPQNELTLKRIVRRNGQSIYKINGETKTRGEIIETLAHAGIDPHGFNMVLQGQIASIVKMHPDARRKVIEEVAGIAIYETRKEKSLKELEKTEARLKEISTVLRERRAYLNNLERERAQALRFKDLELTIKRCKASITQKKMDEKLKELTSIRKSIEQKTELRDSERSKIQKTEEKIESLNEEINKINKHIQKSTGLEQDKLHEAIANLRAELEGSKVRRENHINRQSEIQNRINHLEESIPEFESEIAELKNESPLIAKKQEELKKKKEELQQLEEEKKKTYALKTELNNIRERLKEKESRLTRIDSESDSLLGQIEEYASSFNYPDIESCKKNMINLTNELQTTKESLSALSKSELKHTNNISSAKTQIMLAEETKAKVKDIDVCPLCQNKMTEKHHSHVISDSDSKISEANKLTEESQNKLKEIKNKKQILIDKQASIETRLSSAEKEKSSHNLVLEKQEYMKKLIEESKLLESEVKTLESKRQTLESKTIDTSRIEESYSYKLREIEEISSRTEKDIDNTLLFKQRELEGSQEAIRIGKRDLTEIQEQITDIEESITEKSENLEKKEEEERKLTEKYQQLFEQIKGLQEKLQEESYNLSTTQNEMRNVEDQINYLKVGNAKIDAEHEALEMELNDYFGIELIKASMNVLQERLQKCQSSINTIGSINMRALEVYDEIKEEYDKVQEKVNTLDSEKGDILSIIEEIDKKKKKTFMKTFKGINEIFTRNFEQLYTKGKAFLEIENKEDIFDGGINIIIRMAKGKYFDVTSLSGGEQTLIALSLLFAIQEHKPYHFYIFDEIDAALDKRNSERLSSLLKKYIKAGQYIIVTHNDAIITDSNHLYGVSMHDGISKVLSLKLD